MVKVITVFSIVTGALIPFISNAEVFDFDVNKAWGINPNIKVIHDSGKAISINEYYRKIDGAPSAEQTKVTVAKEMGKALKKQSVPDKEIIKQIQKGHFPVSPSIITISHIVKPVNMRSIPNVQENLFVIGNDKHSLRWVMDNKEELINFNATGVLTKVDSIKEFKKIRDMLVPLRIMPVSADFITTNFDVWTYPVLITPKGEFR